MDQEMQHQDTMRLRLLPPLAYEMMQGTERLAFIQWYQQTQECRELFQRYPQNALGALKAAVAVFPLEEPADARLRESLARSFAWYAHLRWSLKGIRPPQPGSYYLFRKRFSEDESKAISLVIPPSGMVPKLVFNLRELDQIYGKGLPTIITAVGSKELHFHELGTVRRIGPFHDWRISVEEAHFRSAMAEFTGLNMVEVWFRRAKNGMPQFIFCPRVFASLPLLVLPLSQPGQPRAVLELSRLETMPVLVAERFSAEHKDGFYEWLIETNNSGVEDDDLGSLEFAPLLFCLYSDDFRIPDPEIPQAARLYKEYVKERWSMPHKNPPWPTSFYLFESGVQPTGLFWIELPQELMQRANSLILNAAELDQLANSNALPVSLSVHIDSLKYLAVAGMLENVGANCGFSFSNPFYRDILRYLRTGKHLELWFARAGDTLNFIITPRVKRPDSVLS